MIKKNSFYALLKADANATMNEKISYRPCISYSFPEMLSWSLLARQQKNQYADQ